MSEKQRGYDRAEVLVLAPRFPSINQPWMDTYLEQLQAHDLRFCVVSESNSTRRYHEKVDRLGFRQYVISVLMEKPSILRSVLCSAFRQPKETFTLARIAWQYNPSQAETVGRLKTILRVLHCAYSVRKLRHVKVIHAHSELFGYYFLPLATQHQLPMVLTFHGLEPHGLPQLPPIWRQQLGQGVLRILVNTEAAKQQAIMLGYPKGKIMVLPQGLPLEDYPFRPQPAPNRSEPIHILTIGRYHRDKGQAYALLALRRLVDKRIDAYWHFVGAGPDKGRLEVMAQRLGIVNRVTFHVDLDLAAIRILYQQCCLFVLPSLKNRAPNQHVETQGVVLQEAQASGCIPIATKVGGIPECIHDKNDGILISDRSHRAIANAICYLLERPEQWLSYQSNGRKNVEERFSADLIGGRMAEFLKGVGWSSNEQFC